MFCWSATSSSPSSMQLHHHQPYHCWWWDNHRHHHPRQSAHWPLMGPSYPQWQVPFREAPKLNPRRRASSRQSVSIELVRRRSLSHCSSSTTMTSSGQQHPQQPQRYSAQPQLGKHRISPSPSMASVSAAGAGTLHASDYGTLRRIPADAVPRQPQHGAEPNVPRILVIPRGPKGFGFILRGARHSDSQPVEFRPSGAVPALQFFEGVDMSGMAMRAGLRPGDFLLEINGVDVRAASHEQVVELIRQCGDTITLKVITVDVDALRAANHSHYAVTTGRMRNHSVPRNGAGAPPPPPPQRNPSTTLSFGRAAGQCCASELPPAGPSSASGHSAFNGTVSGRSGCAPPALRVHIPPHAPPAPAPPPHQSSSPDQPSIRCASVKLGRPASAVRRISAAELEHLMSNPQQQQHQVAVVQQMITLDGADGAGGGHKKFTSVAEMKRRKQNQMPETHNHQMAMKGSASSPDINGEHQPQHQRLVLRPKTPPPPPPPQTQDRAAMMRQAYAQPNPETQQQTQQQHQQPIYASTVVVQVHDEEPPPACSSCPAPPPPPPPNFLRLPLVTKTSASTCLADEQRPGTSASSASSSSAGADCRGVSAQALQAVRLKPVLARTPDSADSAPSTSSSCTTTAMTMTQQKTATAMRPADFDSDLRSALAKRRNKAKQANSNAGAETTATSIATNGNANGVTVVNRYNAGLSLRESVLENVTSKGATASNAAGAGGGQQSKHSPPGGFIGTKKDSGYASSRTSLEPSEYGDCYGGGEHSPANSHPQPHHLPVQHRVAHMETAATVGTRGERERVLQASPQPPPTSLMVSTTQRSPAKSLSAIKHRLVAFPDHPHHPAVRTPPVDYDDEPDPECQPKAKSVSTDSGQDSASSSASSSASTDDRQSANSAEGVVLVVIEQHDEKAIAEGTPGSASPQTTASGTTTDGDKESPALSDNQFRELPVEDWTPGHVAQWLRALELHDDYAPAFAHTSGAQLLRLDRARFCALGITRVAHRQAMEQSLRTMQRRGEDEQ